MIKDRVGLPKVIEFIERKLSDFDVSKIKYISLNEKSNGDVLHGQCAYPSKNHNRTQYQIRGAVNPHIPYPATHIHWGRIPDPTFKQGWRSGEATYKFNNVEEAAVHVLAHEIGHFLLREKQIKEKNVEANCNMIADQWLSEFRKDNE
jgi:hypothetical protein